MKSQYNIYLRIVRSKFRKLLQCFIGMRITLRPLTPIFENDYSIYVNVNRSIKTGERRAKRIRKYRCMKYRGITQFQQLATVF